VVRCAKGTSKEHYEVRYYERQTLQKKADGLISAEPIAGAAHFDVWVPDVKLPSVDQPTAEAALSRAMRWLVERRNNQNKSW
jgi:hypothetical protein